MSISKPSKAYSLIFEAGEGSLTEIVEDLVRQTVHKHAGSWANMQHQAKRKEQRSNSTADNGKRP
ncbi:hypothetical protein FHS18_005719 [Paenibacillus phyllosphaerae]|uniref:Uncharacterized protein n=1 Tax=Paenibacillus phyllosphaerae TaxID=274593 RepID=A0A7W5FQM4_9BACL|nr:hypothetical protein [Paenibacillus phyllosphaerae]MBB3113606.1 hypothetical protein [Paenibacillus phyllosphaerae]